MYTRVYKAHTPGCTGRLHPGVQVGYTRVEAVPKQFIAKGNTAETNK